MPSSLANGPSVWFMTNGEAMEIRMVQNSMEDCVAAASTLNARFFIMRHKEHLGAPDGWAVYDTKIPNPPDSPHTAIAMTNGRKIRPRKTFDTETIDGPVMWCVAMGAAG